MVRLPGCRSRLGRSDRLEFAHYGRQFMSADAGRKLVGTYSEASAFDVRGQSHRLEILPDWMKSLSCPQLQFQSCPQLSYAHFEI